MVENGKKMQCHKKSQTLQNIGVHDGRRHNNLAEMCLHQTQDGIALKRFSEDRNVLLKPLMCFLLKNKAHTLIHKVIIFSKDNSILIW